MAAPRGNTVRISAVSAMLIPKDFIWRAINAKFAAIPAKENIYVCYLSAKKRYCSFFEFKQRNGPP